MITQYYLKTILTYDPIKGIFKWRNRPEWTPEMNLFHSTRNAGSINKRTGYAKIKIDGIDYNMGKLAVLYMTGKYPGRLAYVNGIASDVRFENLIIKAKTTSKKAAPKITIGIIRNPKTLNWQVNLPDGTIIKCESFYHAVETWIYKNDKPIKHKKRAVKPKEFKRSARRFDPL